MIEFDFNCSIIVELLLNPITDDQIANKCLEYSESHSYGSEYWLTGGMLNIQTASAPHAKCQKSHDLKIFGIFENEYSYLNWKMKTLLFLELIYKADSKIFWKLDNKCSLTG